MRRTRMSSRSKLPLLVLLLTIIVVGFILYRPSADTVAPVPSHYTSDYFGVVLDYREVIMGAQEVSVPLSPLLGVTGSLVATKIQTNFRTTYDVSALVPRALRARLRDEGATHALTIHVPIGWNYALLRATCMAYADLKGKDVHLLKLVENVPVTGLLSERDVPIGALGVLRAEVGGSGWSQRSLAVRNKGDHVVVSAVLLGQALCGSGPSTAYTPVGEVPKYIDGKVHPSIAARIATTVEVGLRIQASFFQRMIEEVARLTPTSPRRLAEELLLSKVAIWNPLVRPPVPERLALAILFRPTIACMSLTAYGDGLRMALLQFRLWGYQCDRFIIFLGNDEPQDMADFDELVREVGIPVGDVVPLKIPSYIAAKGTNNVWQRLREALVWIDGWSQARDYHYYYMVQPDVYAIPENLYAMLLEPGLYYLNAASTPLFLGRRMLFPETNATGGVHFTPYINTRAGFVINYVTMRLLGALLPTGDCHDHAVSSSIDLLLLSCLSRVDILPRDTADDIGEERFHVLSLHWLLMSTKETSGWYVEQQARSMEEVRQNPLRLVAASSIAFGQVESAERALWFHKVLRE